MQSIFEASQNQDDDDTDSNSFLDEQYMLRIQTAPARPITELEEFKRSVILKNIIFSFIDRQISFYWSRRLFVKTISFKRISKSTIQTLRKAKEYAKSISILQKNYVRQINLFMLIQYFLKRLFLFKLPHGATEMISLEPIRYFTSRIDCAILQRFWIVHRRVTILNIQFLNQGFPYLWVNGQKYVFSPQVLEAGGQLMESFYRIQHVVRHAYSRICQESPDFSIEQVKKEVSAILEQFDDVWVNFEKLYVIQLMFIEAEARKYITQAIDIDKELTSIEILEKLKGKILVVSEEVLSLKKKLCKSLAQINSVSNMEGKGRDDLGHEILLEAEGIIRRVTKEQSKAVRGLAEMIKQTFQKFRDLIKKYDENIEMVDPQLKNNVELVEILTTYETSWEKGANYFLNKDKCAQLILFSHIIETTGEKYQDFQTQIEERDAEIFVIIPQLLVIKNLEHEDKNICSYFLPTIKEPDTKQNKLYVELQVEFQNWRSSHTQLYEYHNILEKMLICTQLTKEELESVDESKTKIQSMLQKIKLLAIDLQRQNANEWNMFIDAAVNTNY